MSEGTFDANQFLMMISVVRVSTKHLRDEMFELTTHELEFRWQQLLSTFHSCFAYAQTYEVDLREYKAELSDILDNLYSVEELVRKRKDGKITIVDDIAQGVMFIASKIDDVLAGLGWKRVVRPITEAIFVIPKKIMAMFSRKTEIPSVLPEIVQTYLPPPMKFLPDGGISQSLPVPGDDNVDHIDVEWVESGATEESFAQQLLRQWRERIARAEAESE